MFDEYGKPITSAMASQPSSGINNIRSYYGDMVSDALGVKNLPPTSSTEVQAPLASKDYLNGIKTGLQQAGGDSEGILGFDSFGDLLSNKYALGNISGLASTLMQAVSLPSMLENAKLQNKSLKFNLDTAKLEQARRNKNISSFNNVNTSAFV